MPGKIIGICTAYEGVEYVPHFIRHYSRLGVDQLFILANTAKNLEQFDIIRSMAKGFPVTVIPTWQPTICEGEKIGGERAVLNKYSTDEDWILHLDLDEFHEYPFPLRQVCDAQDEKKLPLIHSDFRDRLAIDGTFKKLLPEPSIFQQFPVSCRITQYWIRQCHTKVMLCRGWVRLNHGRHRAENAPVEPPAIGDWGDYRVHHFKWINGWIERQQNRIKERTLHSGYLHQSASFISTIIDNRIEPNAAPMAQWVGEYCPPEDRVCRPKLNARLAFGMCVRNEPLEQLEGCLLSLRAVYPSAQVFVIADGNTDLKYGSVCQRHGADYIVGERLKLLCNGARWWGRMLRQAATYNPDYFFKIDPDTRFHRKFAGFPNADIFGSLDADGGNIQGGCQGFRAATTFKKILAVCDDLKYANPKLLGINDIIRKYMRGGQISTDAVLNLLSAQLGLVRCDWREVHSTWVAPPAFRAGVAVTHPHKGIK